MSKKDYKTYRQENKEMIYDNHLALCKGCGLCIEFCPAKCITWHQTNRGHFGGPAIEVDLAKCIKCGTCERICPDGAIAIQIKKIKNKK
jgi:2-oxoglutarate ferredoxin oxidoreductase subunit delta